MKKRAFATTIKILFPTCCQACRRPLRSGFLCSSCSPGEAVLLSYRDGNEFSAISRHYSLWRPNPQALEIVKQLKYRRRLQLAEFVAYELAAAIPELTQHEWDCLVPIPTPFKTLWQRGFNHCAAISAQLIRLLPAEFAPRLDLFSLQHKGYKHRQALLTEKLRFQNPRDSFFVSGDRLTDKRILLLDDIVTTGATSEFAARALVAGGAREITLLSLVRSPRWMEHSYQRRQIFGPF